MEIDGEGIQNGRQGRQHRPPHFLHRTRETFRVIQWSRSRRSSTTVLLRQRRPPTVESICRSCQPSLKKRTSSKLGQNFKLTRESSRSVLLTKNPQPILQSLGSEGDAVVSFWSFMVVVVEGLCSLCGVDVLACVCRANAEEFLRAPRWLRGRFPVDILGAGFFKNLCRSMTGLRPNLHSR